jgi:hypothetical protein
LSPLAPGQLILNPLNPLHQLILNPYQPNTCFSQVTEKRAARASEALQRELDRELAAREVARNTAGVQLERVRLQMEEVARPLQYAASTLNYVLLHLGMEMSMVWDIPVFGYAPSSWMEMTVSPPTESHTVNVHLDKLCRHPTPINSVALDAAGVDRLQNEPVWLARWVETWNSVEPFLCTIEDIIMTKAHLNEPIKLSTVTSFGIPFAKLGASWDQMFLSPGNLYQWMVVWVRQWCAHKRENL